MRLPQGPGYPDTTRAAAGDTPSGSSDHEPAPEFAYGGVRVNGHSWGGLDTDRRVAVRLEGLTIGWNTIEAVIAITARIGASSLALVGFGLDSVVEVSAALVVLWQFFGIPEDRETRALRFIGGSFFALAAYVAVSSVYDLATRSEPNASTVGIVLTAVSFVVMPALAIVKRRAGRRIGSRTLVADSGQTRLCAYLSASTLAGLAANAAFGWWWADPLAALVIAYVAVTEGREAWRGDTCC